MGHHHGNVNCPRTGTRRQSPRPNSSLTLLSWSTLSSFSLKIVTLKNIEFYLRELGM